jgi:hypothetical protein
VAAVGAPPGDTSSSPTTTSTTAIIGCGRRADAVFDRRFVRVILRKGQHGNVKTEVTERGQTPWDGGEKITRWLWRQGERPAGTTREAEADRLKWDNPY